MPASNPSDHDDTSSSAAEPRAELTATIEGGKQPEPSPLSFLDRIGMPGLADIEFDTALPFSPPRAVDLD